MAEVRMLKSDMSGELIPRDDAVRVRLMYSDGRPDRRCDLSVEEAERLLPFAVEVVIRPTRRVPKPKPA